MSPRDIRPLKNPVLMIRVNGIEKFHSQKKHVQNSRPNQTNGSDIRKNKIQIKIRIGTFWKQTNFTFHKSQITQRNGVQEAKTEIECGKGLSIFWVKNSRNEETSAFSSMAKVVVSHLDLEQTTVKWLNGHDRNKIIRKSIACNKIKLKSQTVFC